MLNKLNVIIDKKDKFNLILFFFLLLISTLVEMIGLGSLPIFAMAIVDSESLIEKLPTFFTYDFVSDLNQKKLIIYLSLIVTIVFLIKNLFLVFVNFFNGLVIKRIRKNLTNMLFKNYINSNYEFHISRNSADLIRNVYSEVARSVYYLIGHISLIKESLILIVILVLLVIANSMVAVLIFGFLGFFSFLFFLYTRNSSKVRGKFIQEYWGKQTKTLKHGLGSIKEIKMLNKENFISKIFNFNTEMIEKYNFIQSFIVTLPRLFLEVATILAITIVCSLFVISDKSVENIIPIIVLISVSAIRLIPSFSTISQSIATIKYQSPAFDLIVRELNEMKKATKHHREIDQIKHVDIFFKKKIEVKNLIFKYPSTEKKVIDNLSISINKGEAIGIAGASGEGKSTLLDLICGLLKPTSGQILVDEIDINSKKNNWRSKIGYVPQDIYLLDDSIKSNIAFGVEDKNFSSAQFEKAIKMSQLSEFLENLPDKELTYVGDDGVRLSGGQKQRIGIARALYFLPEVLILDEPTSSLDEKNETLILDDIYNIKSKITIIIISHSKKVFKKCDKIIEIKSGKIIL